MLVCACVLLKSYVYCIIYLFLIFIQRHSSHGQYKGESSTKGFTEEKLKVLSQKALSRTAVSKKGPIKGDHTIWTTKDVSVSLS